MRQAANRTNGIDQSVPFKLLLICYYRNHGHAPAQVKEIYYNIPAPAQVKEIYYNTPSVNHT